MYSSRAGRYSLRGLSHSDISGSKLVSSSPKLFAAVHVLHRLSSPRHPPCALCSLTLSLRHASRYNAQSPTDDLAFRQDPFESLRAHSKLFSKNHPLQGVLRGRPNLVQHHFRSAHSFRRPSTSSTPSGASGARAT